MRYTPAKFNPLKPSVALSNVGFNADPHRIQTHWTSVGRCPHGLASPMLRRPLRMPAVRMLVWLLGKRFPLFIQLLEFVLERLPMSMAYRKHTGMTPSATSPRQTCSIFGCAQHDNMPDALRAPQKVCTSNVSIVYVQRGTGSFLASASHCRVDVHAYD